MALETLKGVKQIRDTQIMQERPKTEDGSVDWPLFDEQRKSQPIFVDHDVNMISFRIQNGPIKVFGKNGCQVVDLIAVAKHMIEQLNAKFPCEENAMTLKHLEYAVFWQDQRTLIREVRGVEGEAKA